MASRGKARRDQVCMVPMGVYLFVYLFIVGLIVYLLIRSSNLLKFRLRLDICKILTLYMRI